MGVRQNQYWNCYEGCVERLRDGRLTAYHEYVRRKH
jgi:hypothetical protein